MGHGLRARLLSLIAASALLCTAAAEASAFARAPGKVFRCFSSAANCTLVAKLGQGGFGEVWSTDVDFGAPDPGEAVLSARETSVRSELASRDGLRVAAKFYLDESRLAWTLSEANAWARLPSHANVVDLLHVDVFEYRRRGWHDGMWGHTLVMYGELHDEGWRSAAGVVATDLQKALDDGSLFDEARRAQFAEYERAQQTFEARARPGGISEEQLEEARSSASRQNCYEKTGFFAWLAGSRPTMRCSALLSVIRAATATDIFGYPGAQKRCLAGDGECEAATMIVRDFEQKKVASRSHFIALTVKSLENVTWQLASAVAHAHRFGVVHFDIKPPNVIVAPGLVVRLNDFGSSVQAHGGVLGLSVWKPSTLIMVPPEFGQNPFCLAPIASADALSSTWNPFRRVLRYFQIPPCEGVDAYELALTILFLWAGQGLSTNPLSGNWLLDQILKAKESDRHNVAAAVHQLTPGLNTKAGMPLMPTELRKALASMLAKDWRARELSVHALLDAIEAPYGGRQGFMHAMGYEKGIYDDSAETPGLAFDAFLQRARTFLEQLENASHLPPIMARLLAKHARRAAHLAIRHATTATGFNSACKVERAATAMGSRSVERFVPVCLQFPKQCARFAPGGGLILLLGFGVLTAIMRVLWRQKPQQGYERLDPIAVVRYTPLDGLSKPSTKFMAMLYLGTILAITVWEGRPSAHATRQGLLVTLAMHIFGMVQAATRTLVLIWVWIACVGSSYESLATLCFMLWWAAPMVCVDLGRPRSVGAMVMRRDKSPRSLLTKIILLALAIVFVLAYGFAVWATSPHDFGHHQSWSTVHFEDNESFRSLVITCILIVLGSFLLVLYCCGCCCYQRHGVEVVERSVMLRVKKAVHIMQAVRPRHVTHSVTEPHLGNLKSKARPIMRSPSPSPPPKC